jgi:hypothetical protein
MPKHSTVYDDDEHLLGNMHPPCQFTDTEIPKDQLSKSTDPSPWAVMFPAWQHGDTLGKGASAAVPQDFDLNGQLSFFLAKKTHCVQPPGNSIFFLEIRLWLSS